MANSSPGFIRVMALATGAILVWQGPGPADSASIARHTSDATSRTARATGWETAIEPSGATADGVADIQATPDGRLPGVWTNYTNGNLGSGVATDPTNGDVWMATTGGAVRIDGSTGNPTKYTSPDGLGGNQLQGVAVDKKGTKWFAAYGGGLSRLSPDGTWRRFHVADGLTSTALSVALDSEGGAWVGTWNGGANYVSPEGDFTQVLFGHTIRTIAVHPLTGEVWFSSEHNGVYARSASGEFRHYTVDNGLANNDVGPITIDRRGNVWFAYRWGYGVNRLSQDGHWTHFTRATHGLATDRVWSIAVDDTGNAWLGHDGDGVSRLPADGGPCDTFMAEFGQGVMGTHWVPGIAVDHDDNVWFATNGGVVRRSSDGSWARIEMEDVIQQNYLSTVASDGEGGVWVGTDHGSGVSRLSLGGGEMRFDETNSPLGIGAITWGIRSRV